MIKGTAIVLASAVVGTSAEGPPDLSSYDFQAYLSEHARVYDDAQYPSRKIIFDDRLHNIRAHNELYRTGNASYWMGVSHLTDSTVEEFQKLRASFQGDAWKSAYGASASVELFAAETGPNPDSVDWRTDQGGKLTPVKNQGGCGSCWAFAATETVEAHYAIHNKVKPIVLAPQAMVNCVKNPHTCGGTGGCEGATDELGMDLAISKGLPLEADLPYQATDGACAAYTAAVKATGVTKVAVNDASALQAALVLGPVAVTVAAGSWQTYGGGVFSGCSDSGDAVLDHGVQAAGYTKEYWLIRNSWGPGWGEHGFIRLSRKADHKTLVDKSPADGTACLPLPKSQTVGGECGVLFDTSFPTGVTAASAEIVV